MAERKHTRVATLALCFALALGLSGCESLRGLLGDSRAKTGTVSDLEPLAAQLSELELLSEGTFKQKLDLFAAIAGDYEQNPSDTNRLRLALAKSVIDHPSIDMQGAFSELRALLEGDTALSLAQHQFALMMLKRIEYEIILETDNARLRGELEEEKSSDSASASRAGARLAAARRRLADAEAENQRLADELQQAREQLDAIMSIETSSDRTN